MDDDWKCGAFIAGAIIAVMGTLFAAIWFATEQKQNCYQQNSTRPTIDLIVLCK